MRPFVSVGDVYPWWLFIYYSLGFITILMSHSLLLEQMLCLLFWLSSGLTEIPLKGAWLEYQMSGVCWVTDYCGEMCSVHRAFVTFPILMNCLWINECDTPQSNLTWCHHDQPIVTLLLRSVIFFNHKYFYMHIFHYSLKNIT